jgi:hypothetical protein
MSRKSIELIVSPPEPHFVGDGFRVHNFIPSTYRLDMQRMNPFIMLDYNSNYFFPPSLKPKGVGVHPHRGFETVTIAYKGKIAHHDSSGGGGIISEGEVQWMTAASGVLHKEYHEEEWSKSGGEFQMVQLWINLPAKNKMSPPKYQAIGKKEIKRHSLGDEFSWVDVIAGEYNGTVGAAQTFTPIHLYNVVLGNDHSCTLSFPSNYNTALLVIEGEITVNNNEYIPTDHLVLMANDGVDFIVTSKQNALVLVLSAETLDEPIAAHGPFVMNTRAELIQAFTDYQNGMFGHLDD